MWRGIVPVRRRLLLLALGEGILRVLLLLGLLLSVAMVLDWWVELTRPVRIITLGLITGAVLVGAWRWLVGPVRNLPARDALALYIERRRPELRSRLISALQLARLRLDAPEGEAFVGRLVDDAQRAASDLDLRELAPANNLGRAASWIVPVIIAAGGLFFLAWPDSFALLQRVFLVEVALPRKTHLLEVTGSRTVGRGDDLMIQAVAGGILPKSGRLLVRHPSGRIQTLPLEADPSSRGRYQRQMGNLPGSFDYRVRINDAESAEFRVEVLPRPMVTNLTLIQELPAYTGLADRQPGASGLVLLRGSALRVSGIANQDLSRAEVRLGGVEEVQNATIASQGSNHFDLALQITNPHLNSFSIDLVDQHGISSRDSPVYPLQVVADHAPRVRMLLPTRREELATLRGTVLLSFEAVDDFGLDSLRLFHEPAGSTNKAPQVIELDLTGETNSTVLRRFEWRMEALTPAPEEGTLVEFWIEARDRNTVDGPGVGESDHYLLRFVSEAEKRADLLGRAGDAIGRLGGVAQGQERLNETLGRIILERPQTR